MARDDDDSSSSGFSSDEDMADEVTQPSATSLTPSVAVEVLEEEEASEDVQSTQNPPQCCQDATQPLLEAENPYSISYDQYTAAIGHLSWHWSNVDASELDQLQRLRAELYRRFQQAFPLTEHMYTQWISDVAATSDFETVNQLFQLAKADYWSVTLTLQQLKFHREQGQEAELKTLMEQAQETVGVHFARGHEVWALCREMTTEMFDEMEGDVELQKEKALRELFYKQMQLPLDQNDLAMSEFRAWDAYNTLDGNAGETLEDAATRQKDFAPLMKKLRGFEARVSAAPGAEANPEQAWMQYLNFVKHRLVSLMMREEDEGEGRQFMICLYERAVATTCLSPAVWASYLEYLEADKPEESTGKEKLEVARRAVRNVSFDSSVWTEMLIEMERQRKPMGEISAFVRSEVLSRSTPPIMDQFHFLSVLLIWCDIVRRTSIDGVDSLDDTVRKVESLVGGVFTECDQFMAKIFPEFLEGMKQLAEYRVKCYWTLVAPEVSRMMPATVMKVKMIQQVWQQKLSTPLGELASSWLAYCEALQRTNAFSAASIRKEVFNEAVKRVKDSPLVLAEAWLVFERENGDLLNYTRARHHHTKIRLTTQPTSLPETAPSSIEPANTKDKKTKASKKRKSDSGATQTKKQQPASKRSKIVAGNTDDDNAAAVVSTTVQAPKPVKQKAVEKKKIHESLTNEHTLFMCNVSKDASKEDVEALFKDISSVKDVRLVVKARGDRVKSRGMAYVQFSDEAGVEEGLKKNGALVDGHPVSVERSRPPSTSASTPAKATGSQNHDPVTLFVGNLNSEKSKQQVTEKQLQEALQKAMQSAGELVVVTRVSILKDRHGRLKNYGLVEVAEPSQLEFCLVNAAALQATLGEQVTLRQSRFSITHILEQQEKQKKQTQERKANKGANTPHAKPSTRLNLPATGSSTSLMPRALRRKQAAQEAGKTEPPSTSTSIVVPKSNEDFRKMLFKK